MADFKKGDRGRLSPTQVEKRRGAPFSERLRKKENSDRKHFTFTVLFPSIRLQRIWGFYLFLIILLKDSENLEEPLY